MRFRWSLPAAGVLLVLSLAAPPAPAVVLPVGFTSDNVVPDTTFDTPTAMVFLSGRRMLVAEVSR